MDELGWQNEQKAERALKATLHALRDRLVVTEAVQLAAQFPTLIRGMYYENWRPTTTPVKERKKLEFLAHVAACFNEGEDVDAEEIVRAVFTVLRMRVTKGEIDDIRHALPKEIRDLWD